MFSARQIACLIGLLVCVWSCGAGPAATSGDTTIQPPDSGADLSVQDDAPEGVETEDKDSEDSDLGLHDTGGQEECPWAYQVKPKANAKMPEASNNARGVDALEWPAYVLLRDALLEDPNVHFVATYNADTEHYLVTSGDEASRIEVAFTRQFKSGGGVYFELSGGALEEIFPQTISQLYGDYAELLSTWSNPNNVALPEHAYIKNDPRIGYLSHEQQSYPWVLARLASVFDAPDAPDMTFGVYPWATAATSTHGGMGLLQSRSTLILSGRGVRSGVVEDSVAMLPDVAPTLLAALGASSTGGVGYDGKYKDGLYLKRQDGRVLWEALDTQNCALPKHVIVILYDGLLANEINHLALDDDAPVDLPTFRQLAKNGVVYRYGAITNYPSVSAPGHTTVGTGLWNGSHGVLANVFFRRESQEDINPFSLISDPKAALENPDLFFEMYDKMVAAGVENLAQAAHRAFGQWSEENPDGAFVAVINEFAIKDADWTTLDYAKGILPGNPMAGIAEYELLDGLAVNQVEALLSADGAPVPTILQLSFLTTDGVGEASGPHSNDLRDSLIEMDTRLASILAAYEARGALKDTLVILTSDHGMELQDPTRVANPGAQVEGSGIMVHHPGSGMLYLRTLELKSVVKSDTSTVEIRVRNHDNKAPLSGVTVDCSGCVEQSLTSGEDGLATFTFLEDTDSLSFTAAHPNFNPQVLEQEL